MILAQYNILGFYTSKSSRKWNILQRLGENEELLRVFLPTNTIPAVQLIVDSATTASIELLDSEDEVVGSPLSMTVEDATTYKRLIYTGTTLTGNSDGDYSIKITCGSDVYYSDVFGWKTGIADVSDVLKVSAVSGNIKLGGSYTVNLTDFTYECYINADYLGLEPETEDEVAQSSGANTVIYGSIVPSREFDIYGNEYIYRFLLGLRILETNGTVTITWDDVDYTATDIRAEKSEEHSPEAIQIKLTFVDKNEIITALNETNS